MIHYCLFCIMLFLIFTRCILCKATLAVTNVCPSVRSSDKRVNCDETKETSAHIFTPHEISIILVFRHREWLVGMPPCLWHFKAKVTPIIRKQLNLRSHKHSKGAQRGKCPFSVKKCTFLEESLLQSSFVWKSSSTKLQGIHWLIHPCKTG